MKLWAATVLTLAMGCVIASGGKKTVNVNADAKALQKENAKLKADVKRLRGELERMRGDPPARSIAGRVTGVEDSQVTVSVGDADGVRVGDIFHLRRGAMYVGRVTIQDVAKDESVGEFDAEFPGRVGPPRAGDLAYIAHD